MASSFCALTFCGRFHVSRCLDDRTYEFIYEISLHVLQYLQAPLRLDDSFPCTIFIAGVPKVRLRPVVDEMHGTDSENTQDNQIAIPMWNMRNHRILIFFLNSETSPNEQHQQNTWCPRASQAAGCRDWAQVSKEKYDKLFNVLSKLINKCPAYPRIPWMNPILPINHCWDAYECWCYSHVMPMVHKVWRERQGHALQSWGHRNRGCAISGILCFWLEQNYRDADDVHFILRTFHRPCIEKTNRKQFPKLRQRSEKFSDWLPILVVTSVFLMSFVYIHIQFMVIPVDGSDPLPFHPSSIPTFSSLFLPSSIAFSEMACMPYDWPPMFPIS